MNEILESLKNLIIFAMVVTGSTDNIESVLTPYVSITKYKLTVAFLLTSIGVIGLNVGIFDLLGIITESALSWIHYADIGFTILILTTGAQGIHKLVEGITNFFANGAKGTKGDK